MQSFIGKCILEDCSNIYHLCITFRCPDSVPTDSVSNFASHVSALYQIMKEDRSRHTLPPSQPVGLEASCVV